MARTILIVLDGLHNQAASTHMGFCDHVVAQGYGARYTLKGELPAMSRPMYETIQSGLPVLAHGITTNFSQKASKENTFAKAKAAGLTTAAAAYYWIYELYEARPFNIVTDRFRLEPQKNQIIDYGIYYTKDEYPLIESFADGHYLAKKKVDYLLIHPMAIDHTGHLYGGLSKEYYACTVAADANIAFYFAHWKDLGYDIVVTSDHGMDAKGLHNGSTALQNEMPLYIFSEKVASGVFGTITQRNIAPLCRALLGLQSFPKEIYEK